MKSFDEYVEDGSVRTGTANPSEARSLRVQAKQRLRSEVVGRDLTEDNAVFIFENAYKSLRQWLQSFLAAKGYKPYSHEAIIAYATENELLTRVEANRLDQWRRVRNDIKYRGAMVQVERVEKIIRLAKEKLGDI